MSKQYPQLNQNIVNKCPSIKFHLGDCFAIREGLLRINKRRLIENYGPNENGYRFHSYDSQVFPTIRTQCTTIPNYANPNLLYIYKKWKCVESLTIPGKGLHDELIGYTLGTSTTHQAYWTLHKSSQPRRRGNLHWYA